MLPISCLKGVSFETAIIERYRRRESSVEEVLIEMYLAGVSVRRIEDITKSLWGSKVSPATISELNRKAYVHIRIDGSVICREVNIHTLMRTVYLRRNWGREQEKRARGYERGQGQLVNFSQWRLSEVLGHTDKATTLRMYTHASQESIERAGNIFRNALQAGRNIK